jgi:S1-C subfamily serine protease
MMITKKDLVVVVIATFCLATTLFMVIPTRSSLETNSYDPWLDINDDGNINILDISSLAIIFGTSGSPVNKTALLLELQNKIETLEAAIKTLENNGILPDIHERVADSIVLIRGTVTEGTVQGSGFVYNFSGIMVVLTNYHVVDGTTSISVTFSNGNGYAAEVNGTDPYADLAVLLVDAPEDEFKALEIASSSTLRVGDPVIAMGNPYGLVGSMTTGVVSALGRTITGESGFAIANVIQTSTPINPGNSGGPLLNYHGEVVGITTAIVADSQGLGFAIPSNTILREIASLVANGTYEDYSYLGVMGVDMDYETAQQLGVTVTYGWRIVDVLSGGPADNAGIEVDDIIVEINGTRMRNGDDVISYLEANTLPGETVIMEVVRDNETLEIPVVLGRRSSS